MHPINNYYSWRSGESSNKLANWAARCGAKEDVRQEDSFVIPTSRSTNQPFPLNQTIFNQPFHTLGKPHNKHPFSLIMAQPPLPNIVTLQAAVNGMAAEGNNIAVSAQAFNAHQQTLNTELSLCANYNVAQIQQQLVTLQASITSLATLTTAL